MSIILFRQKQLDPTPKSPRPPQKQFQQLKKQYAFGDELAGVQGTSVLKLAWTLHVSEICGGMLELPYINLVRPPIAVRISTITWYTHAKGTRDYGTASTTTCRVPTNGKCFKTCTLFLVRIGEGLAHSVMGSVELSC